MISFKKSKKKILLFIPPEFNFITAAMPLVLQKNVGFSPPLGLLYIAASIQKYTDWDVKIIDAVAEKLSYKAIEQRIIEESPDAVGISAMTLLWIDCLKLAKIVRKVSPEIKVIMGGPHIHIYPTETIQYDCVDYAMTGEGEESIAELLNAWGDNGVIKKIQGLCVLDESGRIINNPPRPLIQDLDIIAHPQRQFTKYKLYSTSLADGEAFTTTMVTSRGCPYKCTFCDRPNLGKDFRARTANDVVDEMEECANLGIGYIKIYDDTFTVDRKRVMEICAEIERRGLKIKWDIRARVNTISRELLIAMKSAGCELICYGIESGNEGILQILKKGISKHHVVDAFKLTRQVGIKSLAYFMFGSPGEKQAEIQESIRFSKELNPDFCHFSILVPFPATPLYAQGLRDGIIPGDYWKDFVKNPDANFQPPFWIEHLTEDQLYDALRQAYHTFYIRPSYILKRGLQIRTWGDLMKNFRVGMGILNIAN
jgi:anaerobic magnesium-protoporphyrin IX monomethyl ester cyclase